MAKANVGAVRKVTVGERNEGVDLEEVSAKMYKVTSYLKMFAGICGDSAGSEVRIDADAFSVVMEDLAERCGEIDSALPDLARGVGDRVLGVVR